MPIGSIDHIHGLGFDLNGGGRLYIATQSGLFATAGGGTAEKVSAGSSDNMGFSPHPVYGEVLYASGHPETGGKLGFIASGDGGSTWTQVAADELDQLYAGAASGLWQSADGGRSWELAGPDGVPATMVETAPDGALYVFFAGNGLFKRPTGEQWIALAADTSDDFIMHLAVDPADPSHLVAATRANRLVESWDGGASWSDFAP